MVQRILTENHFEILALVMRLGLGLFLLGNAYEFYGLYSNLALSPAVLLDSYGLHGGVAGFLTETLFEGEYPFATKTFAGAAMIVQALGGAALVLGLFTRLVAGFFAIAVALVWVVHFADATPFIMGEGDSATLKGPISHLKQLALAILFRVSTNVGSGLFSLDKIMALVKNKAKGRTWNTIALEMRSALAIFFLSAGASALFFDVPVFNVPALALAAAGFLVFFGIIPRLTGALIIALIAWETVLKFSFYNMAEPVFLDILSNLPFIAAALVIVLFGAGDKFKPHQKVPFKGLKKTK